MYSKLPVIRGGGFLCLWVLFWFGFFLVLWFWLFWLWWLDLCFVMLGFFFELYVQKEYFLFTGGDRKDNCPSEKLKVLG